MVDRSFEKYWEVEWRPNTMPFLMREAMRHLALKTWNAAINASLNQLDLKTSELIALNEDMTGRELRAVGAVLRDRTVAISNLAN